MQHPAFNAQHAQMLLARGMMGPLPQRPPGAMYRPTNGLFQGPDHGPLPPGAMGSRMRHPHPGPGSVIRHMGQHMGQHVPQLVNQHAPQPTSHPPTHIPNSHQAPTQANGAAATSMQGQGRSSGQARGQDTLHRIHHLAAQAVNLPESMQSRVDSASTKGIFGWTQVDGVDLPFLLRDEKKYLAVRMVEMKLLSKYPSTYPEELKSRPPLMSHYITENEAKILNEINKNHCGGEYGQHLFVTQDLIVKMADFEDFYNIVKKHFPPSLLAQLPQQAQLSTTSQEKKVDGGWVQMNNTVVPYVNRGKARYVPLSVIRYAAGLLTDVRVEGEGPKEEECSYLNDCCKTAGVEFNFVRTTKLVMLDLVQRLCNNTIKLAELPKDDPFSQAEYHGSLDEDSKDESLSNAGGCMSLSTNQMPYPGLSPGAGSRGASSNGPSPPSAASGTPVSQAPSSGGAVPYWMNQHLGIYPGAPGGFPPGGGPHGGLRGPGRPPHAPGIPPPPHQSSQAALANHIPSSSRPSSQGSHISPTASQYQPKSNEVNNNSFGGAQRRSSHEAMDLSRELASPREKKDSSNPPTPSGTPLGRTLSSSSLPQATTPVPRTSSAGSASGGGIHRSTPDGSPHAMLPAVPPGVIPTLHPSLQVGPDGHPVLGSLVPPGHPGWHPMMNNPAEYHKMVQIMQLQAMAQQQQQQQHQLQQQLQMLEQQHLHQQRLKQHEAMSKASRPGPRQDAPRSAPTGAPQIRGRSATTSTPPQPGPSGQQPGGSKPPSATPAQGGSVNKSSLTQAVIQRVEFQGKTLSCIVKGERKEYYALVEALSRVYFPNCTLEDFQFALEKSLQVPLVGLTEDEERSFISFYNIPTKTLMCNKVIRLAEFQELIPQLKAMFRDKLSSSASENLSDTAMPPRGTVLVSTQSGKESKQSSSGEANKESPSSSTPGTPTVSSDAVGKISAALKAALGKRSAPSDNDSTDGQDSPGPSKQPKVSIEDAVNRLRQFQAEQKSKRKSSKPARRTGSQSPTSDTPTEYMARSPDTDMQSVTENETEPLEITDKEETADKVEGDKGTDRSEPMEVDNSEPVEAESKESVSESSASQQPTDLSSLKVASEAVPETPTTTGEEEAVNVESTEHVTAANMVLDFSSKSKEDIPTDETVKDADHAETEKDKDVKTSTERWANTQPETASEDLLLIEKKSVDTTTDEAEIGIDYSTSKPDHSDKYIDAKHSSTGSGDTIEVLNLAVSSNSVDDVANIQVPNNENADTDSLANTKEDNPENEQPQSGDLPAIPSGATVNTESSAEENKSAIPSVDNSRVVDTEETGDKVLSEQPVDLHSTPAAQDNIVSEVDTSALALGVTMPVSAESRLEFAEAQSASTTVNSDRELSMEDQGPVSTNVNELNGPEQPSVECLESTSSTSQEVQITNTDDSQPNQDLPENDISNQSSAAQSETTNTQSSDADAVNPVPNEEPITLAVTNSNDDMEVTASDDIPLNLATVSNTQQDTDISPMETAADTREQDVCAETENLNQSENSKTSDSFGVDPQDTQQFKTVTAIDINQETPSDDRLNSNKTDDSVPPLTSGAPCQLSPVTVTTNDDLQQSVLNQIGDQSKGEEESPSMSNSNENVEVEDESSSQQEMAVNLETTPKITDTDHAILNTEGSNLQMDEGSSITAAKLSDESVQDGSDGPVSLSIDCSQGNTSTTTLNGEAQKQEVGTIDPECSENNDVRSEPIPTESTVETAHSAPIMDLFPGLDEEDDEDEDEDQNAEDGFIKCSSVSEGGPVNTDLPPSTIQTAIVGEALVGDNVNEKEGASLAVDNTSDLDSKVSSTGIETTSMVSQEPSTTTIEEMADSQSEDTASVIPSETIQEESAVTIVADNIESSTTMQVTEQITEDKTPEETVSTDSTGATNTEVIEQDSVNTPIEEKAGENIVNMPSSPVLDKAPVNEKPEDSVPLDEDVSTNVGSDIKTSEIETSMVEAEVPKEVDSSDINMENASVSNTKEDDPVEMDDTPTANDKSPVDIEQATNLSAPQNTSEITDSVGLNVAEEQGVESMDVSEETSVNKEEEDASVCIEESDVAMDTAVSESEIVNTNGASLDNTKSPDNVNVSEGSSIDLELQGSDTFCSSGGNGSSANLGDSKETSNDPTSDVLVEPSCTAEGVTAMEYVNEESADASCPASTASTTTTTTIDKINIETLACTENQQIEDVADIQGTETQGDSSGNAHSSTEQCPLSSDTALNLQEAHVNDTTSQGDLGLDSSELIDSSSMETEEDMEVPDSDLEAKLLESPPGSSCQEANGEGLVDSGSMPPPATEASDVSNVPQEAPADVTVPEMVEPVEDTAMVPEAISQDPQYDPQASQSDEVSQSQEVSEEVSESNKISESETSQPETVEPVTQEEAGHCAEEDKTEQVVPSMDPTTISEDHGKGATNIFDDQKEHIIDASADQGEQVTNVSDDQKDLVTNTSEDQRDQVIDTTVQEESNVVLTVTSSKQAATESLEEKPSSASESPKVNVSNVDS